MRRAALLGVVIVAVGCGGGGTPAPSPSAVAASSSSPSGRASAAPHHAPTLPIGIVGSRRGREPFRMTELRNGKVRYAITADSLRGHYAGQDTGTSVLVNPHITFLATAGKQLVAVAPAGTVVEKDKTVVMTGGVHARSQDGMTLASDTLRYDDETQVVHGAGHVVVTFPRGERLDGETVDWNLRTGDVEMNTGTQ
jgi:LPS export ABC transporter protein LptC